MELNWSTFLLEIINFLVLVWILKHFLYRPVLDVIARRRAAIEAQLAEARQLRDEAENLKAEYENRLADWEHEREQAREALARELDEERARQRQALQETLAAEREKARVAEMKQRAEATREIEHRALQQSARFASRLLSQAAGPELEARLFELLLDDLARLSSEKISALRSQWGETPKVIHVTSAYPLTEQQRQRLQQALAGITGLDLPVDYSQDPELLAGLRITIGAWVLHADVRDELKAFAEFAHVTR